jgi:hypothetical protein
MKLSRLLELFHITVPRNVYTGEIFQTVTKPAKVGTIRYINNYLMDQEKFQIKVLGA